MRRGHVNTGALVLLGLVLGYVPLALTSFWHAFLPQIPHLQVSLDGWIGGEVYALGEGSVHALREVDYADHRLVMLVHATLGTLCLLLALWQACGPRRRHAAMGRWYLALVTVSMTAAVIFLLQTDAGPGAGQVAFRWQLWVLAASTLGSAWLAAIEAVRGRLVVHRAWMLLHIAFLMTAPALRFIWSCLGLLLPDRQMLANIELGAVFLAVAAPGIGVLAAVGQQTHRPVIATGTVVGRATVPSWCVGLVGLGVMWSLTVCSGIGTEYPAAHTIAVAALLLGFKGRSSRRLGSLGVGPALVVVRAVAGVPWSVALFGAMTAPWLGWQTGLLVGIMVAPGFPIVAAMVRVLDPPRTDVRGIPPLGRAISPSRRTQRHGTHLIFGREVRWPHPGRWGPRWTRPSDPCCRAPVSENEKGERRHQAGYGRRPRRRIRRDRRTHAGL